MLSWEQFLDLSKERPAASSSSGAGAGSPGGAKAKAAETKAHGAKPSAKKEEMLEPTAKQLNYIELLCGRCGLKFSEVRAQIRTRAQASLKIDALKKLAD